MKHAVTALLVCAPAWSAQAPRWETNLQDYRLQSFDRQASATWMNQQGILFLEPDKIVLYQVNRKQELAKLGPRGAGGGAGNFLLNIKVLSADGGRILRSIEVPTSGGDSRVLTTRSGFVVLAGSILYSYSPAFERIAVRELSLGRTARIEDWRVRVSPSGNKLVLLHEQVFMAPELLADQTVIHDGKAKVEVQILNAATLRTEKSFTLQHTLAFWALLEGQLITSNPAHSYSDGQMGGLDFDGNWSPVKAEVPKESNACRLGMNAIDEQRVVLFGCDAVTVLSSAGERMFTHHDLRLMYVSALAAGPYLAVQCDIYRMEASGPGGGWLAGTRADRVEVYDLNSRARRISVPIHGSRAYYAISAHGDLAVIDGPTLRVFHVET